jgi:hypothetical protein
MVVRRSLTQGTILCSKIQALETIYDDLLSYELFFINRLFYKMSENPIEIPVHGTS